MNTSLFPPAYVERRSHYREFMDKHVFPNEHLLDREDDAARELIASLQETARTTGLWAPHMPPEAGGTGDGFLYYACMNEEIGRSHWAQLVFGCQAPTRATRRSCTTSAHPSRRTASSSRSWLVGRARSSR